jgi:lysophospholipase L1-like esterase
LPAPFQQAAGAPAPPPRIDRSFNNQTVRMVVHTSLPGRRVRVQLSNAYGASTLRIGAAHIALHGKESEIAAGSDRALTFSGKAAATIPPGALLVSDPVDLSVPRLGDVVVSVYVADETGLPTLHNGALHTTYISNPGDFTGQPSLADAATTRSWYWLASVDILAPADTGLIVAFGDSITDGATSTPDTNSSYPAVLAQRIAKSMPGANIAVVNQGIAGNRLLHDLVGTNALARFDRDVLSQTGVRWLILLEGINDIGRANATEGAITADDVIAAHRQIIERAHMHGIKVMGATLTPYEGAAYYSEAGETIRDAVNTWIRTGGAFDGVVDFEAVVRDPHNPKQIRPEFNLTDHLHPNDAGYKAMAEAIDLSFFVDKPPLSAAKKK